jgi:hypothetical protein
MIGTVVHVGARVGKTSAHEMSACLTESCELMHGCFSNSCALVHICAKNTCAHVHTYLGEIRALWERLRVFNFL